MNENNIIERIKINEEKFAKILKVSKKLEKSLEEFKMIENILKELNNYYGSPEWFLDKEKYERFEIEQIKAGVLAEDGVWNLICDIKELLMDMNKLASKILDSDDIL